MGIVDNVLNVVEVAPDEPFEFVALDFGVSVEEPPEYLGINEPYVPDLGAFMSQIMTSTAASMQMDEIPEIPSATIFLSSILLSQDRNGNKPCISVLTCT